MLRFLVFILIAAISCEAGQDIYWRNYQKGNIPIDAVIAAPTGESLYVGQSIHKGYLAPGTIYPKSGIFVSEYYGRVKKTSDIKIMCSGSPHRLHWEYVDTNNLPNEILTRVIEGGYQDATRWYIGRQFHENEWKIGKVDLTGQYKSLLIWNNNDGTLHRALQFEILTYV